MNWFASNYQNDSVSLTDVFAERGGRLWRHVKSEAIRMKAKWWIENENAFPDQISRKMQIQKRYLQTKTNMESSISIGNLRLPKGHGGDTCL